MVESQVQVKVSPFQGKVIRKDETEEVRGFVVEFQLNSPIEPADVAEVAHAIASAVANKVGNGDTVIVSGRGPIYLHSAIAQELRSQTCGVAIAHFDPKVNGAVVVYPHHLTGAVIQMNPEEVAKQIQ